MRPDMKHRTFEIPSGCNCITVTVGDDDISFVPGIAVSADGNHLEGLPGATFHQQCPATFSDGKLIYADVITSHTKGELCLETATLGSAREEWKDNRHFPIAVDKGNGRRLHSISGIDSVRLYLTDNFSGRVLDVDGSRSVYAVCLDDGRKFLVVDTPDALLQLLGEEDDGSGNVARVLQGDDSPTREQFDEAVSKLPLLMEQYDAKLLAFVTGS